MMPSSDTLCHPALCRLLGFVLTCIPARMLSELGIANSFLPSQCNCYLLDLITNTFSPGNGIDSSGKAFLFLQLACVWHFCLGPECRHVVQA